VSGKCVNERRQINTVMVCRGA